MTGCGFVEGVVAISAGKNHVRHRYIGRQDRQVLQHINRNYLSLHKTSDSRRYVGIAHPSTTRIGVRYQ